MSEKVLDAPCVFCGYNSYNYWQEGTHSPGCPWQEVGGDVDRIAAVHGVVSRLVARVAELEAREAKLRRCVEAADDLSTHVSKLLDSERWSSDGNHLLIHADGILDLDGLAMKYRSVRTRVEKP